MKTRITILALASLSLSLFSCSSGQKAQQTSLKSASPASAEKTTEPKVKSSFYGHASWYSVRTNGGTRTASGERFRDGASTAAHKTLKMGTKVRVTYPATGKSEIVRITDRGPYIRGRVIDVNVGVAKRIGFYKRGVANLKIEVLE